MVAHTTTQMSREYTRTAIGVILLIGTGECHSFALTRVGSSFSHAPAFRATKNREGKLLVSGNSVGQERASGWRGTINYNKQWAGLEEVESVV